MTKSSSSDEVLLNIGKIVAALNSLEFDFISIISRVLHINFDEALCVLAGEKYDKLLSKLSNLVNFRLEDPKSKEVFSSIRNDLDDVNQQRNIYVHSMWDFKDDKHNRLKLQFKLKKNMMFDGSSDFNPAQLSDLLKKIEDAKKRLYEFIDQPILIPQRHHNEDEKNQ